MKYILVLSLLSPYSHDASTSVVVPTLYVRESACQMSGLGAKIDLETKNDKIKVLYTCVPDK